MMNLACRKTEWHNRLCRRCSKECIFISVLFRKNCLPWFIIMVWFRIFWWFIANPWRTCLSQQSEYLRIHRSMKWLYIVPLSRNAVAILIVLQHTQVTSQPPSLNPLHSSSTLWSVCLCKIVWLYGHVLNQLQMNTVCIIHQYLNQLVFLLASFIWDDLLVV